MTRWIPWAFAAAGLAGLGCSTATVSGPDDTYGAGGSAGSASSEGGGGGKGGAGDGTGGGAVDLPCGIDCSTIQAPQCYTTTCDEAAHQCKVVPTDGGEPCDDGKFCTVDETCHDGLCGGGHDNDCGLTPDQCFVIVCGEASRSCSAQPVADGSPCTADDLCTVNTACQAGACVGAARDCFFFPVPDSCHVGQCNPATGACEAQPGNEGAACSDSGDLCMIGKTCHEGLCDGGTPRDCSALSVGCNNGLCDPGSGSCYAEPVPPGGNCLSGTNECNVGTCDDDGVCISAPTPGVACRSQTVGCNTGVCSSAGTCVGQPVPDGGVCVDANWCTVGETCLAGACQGGVPATTPTAYFRESFENNLAGWTLGPTWQIGPAMTSSGHTFGSNPDPASDVTPTADNGVAGVVIGGNAPLGIHPQYYLTSPVINADVPGGVYLSFWRYLNSDYAPYMTNRIEVFNGSRWVVLFESGGSPAIRDATWSRFTYDLTPHKNATLQIRFGYAIGADALVDTVSGWNLDDIEILNAICP